METEALTFKCGWIPHFFRQVPDHHTKIQESIQLKVLLKKDHILHKTYWTHIQRACMQLDIASSIHENAHKIPQYHFENNCYVSSGQNIKNKTRKSPIMSLWVSLTKY